MPARAAAPRRARHGIAALTGDRQRRSDGHVPAHTPNDGWTTPSRTERAPGSPPSRPPPGRATAGTTPPSPTWQGCAAGPPRCLDAVEAEQGTEWPAGDHGAWMDVDPDDPVEVTVYGSPSTPIAVRVPIDVASAWLEENRLRLERVRGRRCWRRPLSRPK
ncbi:DUF5959 family protein [Streptomyces flaveolus]|uniref:DUF5959 family protein n=1 Tax=Streptomyces flaveolus TaxID=67297 RepID=UPI0033BB2ACC